MGEVSRHKLGHIVGTQKRRPISTAAAPSLLAGTLPEQLSVGKTFPHRQLWQLQAARMLLMSVGQVKEQHSPVPASHRVTLG